MALQTLGQNACQIRQARPSSPETWHGNTMTHPLVTIVELAVLTFEASHDSHHGKSLVTFLSFRLALSPLQTCTMLLPA